MGLQQKDPLIPHEQTDRINKPNTKDGTPANVASPTQDQSKG